MGIMAKQVARRVSSFFVAQGASYVLVCTKTLAPHAIAFGVGFFSCYRIQKIRRKRL